MVRINPVDSLELNQGVGDLVLGGVLFVPNGDHLLKVYGLDSMDSDELDVVVLSFHLFLDLIKQDFLLLVPGLQVIFLLRNVDRYFVVLFLTHF